MKSVTTDRHANARDRKRANARKMLVTNRSIFVIAGIEQARADEAARNIALRAAQAAKPKGKK